MTAIVPVVDPIVVGITVSLERLEARHEDDLEALDWGRGLHPAMAGPLAGQRPAESLTALARSTASGEVVGVLDAAPLIGYPGVINVSVYTDAARAGRGVALEAFGRFVLHLFDQGARIVHHEVLALNKPVIRLLAGLGLEPAARLRSHAYAAGRFWDVLVYSYDRDRLDEILQTAFPRADAHLRGVPSLADAEVPPHGR